MPVNKKPFQLDPVSSRSFIWGLNLVRIRADVSPLKFVFLVMAMDQKEGHLIHTVF